MHRIHFVLFVLLLTIGNAYAKDLGVFGQTFPIAEIDMLKWIHARLAAMQQSGEMETLQTDFVKSVKQGAARPTPVEGLYTTTSPRTFFVDPSLIVKRDILDTNGNVLVSAGTHVNPFKKLGHDYQWQFVFFDGDDARQVRFAKEMLEHYPETTKLVLINGDIGNIAKQLHHRIFFDQGGFLVQKLRIAHVPSLVLEHDFKWKITEFDASRYSANPLTGKEPTQ